MDVLQYKIDAKPTDSRNDSLEIMLEKIESLPRIYRYKKATHFRPPKGVGGVIVTFYAHYTKYMTLCQQSIPRIYRYKKATHFRPPKGAGEVIVTFYAHFTKYLTLCQQSILNAGTSSELPFNDADVCTTPNDVEFIYSTPSFSLFPTT